LVVVSEALGSVGLFRPLPVAVTAAAVGVAASALSRPRVVASEEQRGEMRGRRSAFDPISAALAVSGTAFVVARWASPFSDIVHHGLRNFDTLHYHLPFAARFLQPGR